MMIGERLRIIRESKNLSQGDIEQRSGLLRCYVSRVENGLTIPAVETLEKMAHALDMKLYQLFYDSQEPPSPIEKGSLDSSEEWGIKGKNARFLAKLRMSLSRMDRRDRMIVMSVASQFANPKRRKR
jgi:transcriptional regulator with XRE-family HTH domain